MDKRLFFIFLFLFLISLIAYLSFESKNEDNFSIYFFDAGKADSFIISNNDKYIMIDTGEENLKDEILEYFKIHNISKLDYLIITHFDKDHVGSASAIVDNISIDRVLITNTKKDSVYYLNFINSLNDKNIIPLIVSGDFEFNLSQVNVIVSGPEKIYDKNESNNSSLIISIEYGNNSFLFMGDAENARIKDFIELNNKKYDFIKIPYHGNYLKRLDDLFDSTQPKYAVITSSYDDEKTISILEKYNIEFYNTKNGSIIVESDGTNILIKQN